MKVAYVLNTPNAANYKVGEMILPQLESDSPVSYTHLTLPTR